MLRLRQLVLAAHELEPAVGRLRELLGAGIAHHDPGVGAFGLMNAVLTAGRDVVEVVSPQSRTAAAARWLERRGAEGGYMLMVDGPPALVEPGRLATLGARVVHELRLPDITDVHLHPRDVAADAGLVGAVAATFALPVPTIRSATVAGVALDVVPHEEHA